MKKQIFVINGSGGAGKDTVCEIAAQAYRVRNVSSITPIVEIARFAGWDGVKTPEARRLLARLKEVFTEYNDLSFQYCMQQVEQFRQSDEQILFVHIREPEEIARFCSAVPADCQTLLVRRPSLDARGPLGNRADDSVEQYTYDHVLVNDGDLDCLRERVLDFLQGQFAAQEG